MEREYITVGGRKLLKDKKFSDLKPSQKQKIDAWLEEIFDDVFYQDQGERRDTLVIVLVMQRIRAVGIWIPESEIWARYRVLARRLYGEHDARIKAQCSILDPWSSWR